MYLSNHCSTDATNDILKKYSSNQNIFIHNHDNPVFDHGKIANELLQLGLKKYPGIEWIFLLDADEFISIPQSNIKDFVDCLEERGIVYATMGWVNSLFNHNTQQVSAIDTNQFYLPWTERGWQELGHFRKALVKVHENIEIVVGGHYFKTSNNPTFFGKYKSNPYLLSNEEGKILHFEMRSDAVSLFAKWSKLALHEKDSSSSESSPWLERIKLIRGYVERYKNDIDTLNKEWFSEHRTIWGTLIPQEKIIEVNHLREWCAGFLNKKIKQGVKNLCIIRRGHLGDVIMTEPIARELKKYAQNVYLATEQIKAGLLVSDTFKDVFHYKSLHEVGVDFDVKVKLVYENSSNQLSYIEGFAESVDVKLGDKFPKIKHDWSRVLDQEYVLIAPNTSSWLEKERNWGLENYLNLKKEIEKFSNIKVVVLDDSYSFGEMLSLIRHCKIFIGNDSGPGIIAQCFNKKSFIIFGVTEPKYVNISSEMTPIYNMNAHGGCAHETRQEEMDCRSRDCMKEFDVDFVFSIIKSSLL